MISGHSGAFFPIRTMSRNEFVIPGNRGNRQVRVVSPGHQKGVKTHDIWPFWGVFPYPNDVAERVRDSGKPRKSASSGGQPRPPKRGENA
jgi:hypothetical protein